MTLTDVTPTIESATYQALRWGVRPAASGLTTKVQTAIDAVYGAGGGTLQAPPGTYTLDGLTLRDGVYLDFGGSGNTTLDFSAMTTPVNGAAISGSGSLTALPALGANIDAADDTITFATAPDVSAGDVLLIYDSADSSFSGHRASYRAGEYVRVKSVSTVTVTLTTRTYAGYASGGTVSVYKLNPIRCGIRGATMRFASGSSGIKVSLGTGLRFDDLVLRGSDVGHLSLDRCYDVALRGVDAWDNQPEIGLNYGVVIGNSQSVTLTDCFLETARHGLTLGGSDVTGAVPCRAVTVYGGRISGMSAAGNVCGCDLHGNVEHISFIGVDMPHGLILGGDKTVVRGCRIRSGPEGRCIQGSELLGWSHDIEAVCEVTDAHTSGYGYLYFIGESDLTRTDGRFRFAGDLNVGAYAATSGTTVGIYLYNVGGAAANDVEIDATVRSTLPDLGTDALAARVRAADGGGFRSVDLSIRTRRMGVWVQCGPEQAYLHDCVIIEPPQYGLYVLPIGTPAYSTQTIRSHNNYVHRAGHTGITLNASDSATGQIESINDRATDCYRLGTGGSLSTAVSLSLLNALVAVYRGAVVGDTLGNQTGRDNVSTVGTLIEEDITDIGSMATLRRTSITTRRFRGRGAGAPAFAAAVGSTYLRTDGGASTTLYVNEDGTSTWRVV